jgi:hypothetical protein
LGGDYTGCPKCGFVGDLDDFDVLGMPEGILWCNQCDQPIKPIQLEKEPGRVEVDTLTNR